MIITGTVQVIANTFKTMMTMTAEKIGLKILYRRWISQWRIPSVSNLDLIFKRISHVVT